MQHDTLNALLVFISPRSLSNHIHSSDRKSILRGLLFSYMIVIRMKWPRTAVFHNRGDILWAMRIPPFRDGSLKI